jgi:hypothetical protein
MRAWRLPGNVVDIADYRVHEITWRYRPAAARNCHVAVYGSVMGDECQCLVDYARGEAMALLGLADDTDPAILLVAANRIGCALIHALGRRCVIEIEAPARPHWLA